MFISFKYVHIFFYPFELEEFHSKMKYPTFFNILSNVCHKRLNCVRTNFLQNFTWKYHIVLMLHGFQLFQQTLAVFLKITKMDISRFAMKLFICTCTSISFCDETLHLYMHQYLVLRWNSSFVHAPVSRFTMKLFICTCTSTKEPHIHFIVIYCVCWTTCGSSIGQEEKFSSAIRTQFLPKSDRTITMYPYHQSMSMPWPNG
jgi:hypothetical protein